MGLLSYLVNQTRPGIVKSMIVWCPVKFECDIFYISDCEVLYF